MGLLKQVFLFLTQLTNNASEIILLTFNIVFLIRKNRH